MRIGVDVDILIRFGELYRNKDFEAGFKASPEEGILNESMLEKEVAFVSKRHANWVLGFYVGTCWKNKASRLHKLGTKKVKVAELV